VHEELSQKQAVDLSFPVGKFSWEGEISDDLRRYFIAEIEVAPANLRAAVKGLSEEQLGTPYRPDGWTIRQVAHHLPDSHLNAYTRFKLALTEDDPLIKTYDQDRWAQLADSRSVPIEVSLTLLEALHHRWGVLLRSLTAQDYARTFRHPELGVVSLDRNLGLYAWHGRHHVAHITSFRKRMGWD
jgi:hypothetical protein